VAAVDYMKNSGLVDPRRVAIQGGSAGGFTVLASLVAHSDRFQAGASLYGISDLKLLADDTHKFESQYLFRLVGGTPEEVPRIYHDRSPLYGAASIKSPLLVLQGSEDKVVPPAQATAIVKQVQANGTRCEYILFDGEGHGFRSADSVKKSIESCLAFYLDVFGIRE